jgi:hypothetical protein
MQLALAAVDVLLRIDAEPWDWGAASLPVLAGRLGAPPATIGPNGPVLTVAGLPVQAEVDADGSVRRMAIAMPAGVGVNEVAHAYATRLGPYRTSRNGEALSRTWPLASGRALTVRAVDLTFAGIASPEGSILGGPPTVSDVGLTRSGSPESPWVPPEVLVAAAVDLAVRVTDAGYVPVEDESLPDMAAALGGKLAWSETDGIKRHIALPGPPWRLELVGAVTSDDALTWYSELRIDLFGSGDVPGSSRHAGFDAATAAVTHGWGPPTRPGPETRFWHRPNGWTLAVDRSDGVVRLRARTPADPPSRPPD